MPLAELRSDEALTPVVLVGGASQRFGRNKLLEPIDHRRLLVDAPIMALRSVFGSRVWAVGDCSRSVAERADHHIADSYPGAGPIGGIATALAAAGGDVFVLAGDLIRFNADAVLAVLRTAERHLLAAAVLAHTDRAHWCAGLYRQSCLTHLRERISAGEFALHHAMGSLDTASARVPDECSTNVNTIDDLRAMSKKPGEPGVSTVANHVPRRIPPRC
ncbi:MAG: NTP transferase domain-containing protein [Phycisphaeraceae bacterium]|nr:NTP transferase domain-containing protein [Phycisphaeraceae bacterium]